MDSSNFLVSSHTLLRIIIFLLYAAVCSFGYWRFFPHLSTPCKRLATLVLVANLLVTALALEFRSVRTWEGWLLDFDEEWNISTALASTQFAMAGGAALFTAWHARARPKWQRLYLAWMSFVFLFYALDEYVLLPKFAEGRFDAQLALGAVAGAAIIAATWRAPRSERKWHILLFSGLALGAFGAIYFEPLRFAQPCKALGFYFLGACRIYAIEETLEFLGIWLALIAAFGLFSCAIPSPKRSLRRMLYALPLIWIIAIPQPFLFMQLEGVISAKPTSVMFESEVRRYDVHLYGVHLELTEGAVALRLYAIARREAYARLGLSVNLVDQASGESLANVNQHWDRFVGPLLAPGGLMIYRQGVTLNIPPATPPNRALWVTLSLWRAEEDDYIFDSIVSSDQRLLGESQVILGEIVLPAESALRSTATRLALFDNGFSLDGVTLPERVQAGTTLGIPFAWSAEAADSTVYSQFLHFEREDSGEWWVYDQQPLGARLPTRLWYSGLADSETWQVPIPADLEPGRYRVSAGLYRLSDLARLPAKDADGKPLVNAIVPLGNLIIEG